MSGFPAPRRSETSDVAHPGRLPAGVVTFLITDIEGSTRLLLDLDRRYTDVLERHNEIIRAAVAAHGGVTVSTAGDSVFAAFPTARAAVLRAADAQRVLAAEPWPDGRWVRVRMGLHSGEAVFGGDDYVGLDVHRAARISAAANGGQVLLSAETVTLLAGAAAVRDLGEHRLKDLVDPEHLFQLVAPDLPSDFPPVHDVPSARDGGVERRRVALGLGVAPVVGRAEQLDLVADALRAARDGTPAVVVVTAPPGSGKSRLLRSALDSASGGMATSLASAVGALGASPPFTLWAPIVQDLLAVVDDDAVTAARSLGIDPAALSPIVPIPGHDESTAPGLPVEASIVLLLRALARQRPVAIALDDLHWADEASVRTLLALVPLLRTERLAVLVATRPPGAGTTPSLPEVLDRLLAYPGVREIHLEPLSAGDATSLLANLGVEPERRPRIVARADGNPFLLSQLARAPDDRLPDTVQRLVLGSLVGLPAAALDAVRLVGTAGGAVPIDVLTDALGRLGRDADQDLAPALQSGALQHERVSGIDTVAVTHALLAEHVLDALAESRRAALHSTLLDAWLDAETQQPNPAVIARHARGAHDDPLTLEYSLRAALSARDVSAYSDAEPLLDQAAETWVRLQTGRAAGLATVDLWLLRTRNAEEAHDYQKALTIADHALTELAAEPPETLARVHLRRAWVLCRMAEPDAMQAALQAALPDLVDSADRLEAISLTALLHLSLDQQLTDQALVDEGAMLAEAAGDAGSQVRGAVVAAAAGDSETAVEQLGRAVSLARDVGDLLWLMLGVMLLVSQLRTRGREAEALRVAEDALSDVEGGAPDLGYLPQYAAAIVAEISLDRGEWVRAEQIITDPRWTHGDVAGQTTLSILRDRHAALTRLKRPAHWPNPESRHYHETGYELAALEYTFWTGDVDEGARLAHAEPVFPDPAHLPMLAWLRSRALAEAGQMPPEEWGSLPGPAGDAGPQPTIDHDGMAALCEAERARASASDRAQQWLDAAQLLDQASRPYPAAYARWRASELLLLAAPPHQVAGPARQAHDVALTLPMPALAARLAALATRAHITLTTSKTSGAPRNGPLAALTTRELDVLALVADGATNGDIARRLGIKPRTVSAHVATILRKLGVSTRYAAAATYDRSQTSRY